MSSETTLKIQAIDHINIVVSDLEKMVCFYRDQLGFTVSKQVEISGDWIEAVVALKGAYAKVVYLELSKGPRIELIHYMSPPAENAGPTHIANTPGFRHLAFRVKGIEAWVERLTKAGISFFGAIQHVPGSQVSYAGGVQKSLIYFHDPERNILEFCDYRAVK